MKLKIYTLWEDANEDKLKYIEVNICGNYFEYFQSPDEKMEGYEYSKRFFKYEKNNSFKKIFKRIKPNYFITIYHSSIAEEVCDDSSIAGRSGYAYINFFQKQYLDWHFGIHWIKDPKKAIGSIFHTIKEIRKIFY